MKNKFEPLIGRTIVNATQQKLDGYDDEGFLRLEFSDGTHTTIEGGYGEYTGGSEDEYKTLIRIAGRKREKELVNLN